MSFLLILVMLILFRSIYARDLQYICTATFYKSYLPVLLIGMHLVGLERSNRCCIDFGRLH